MINSKTWMLGLLLILSVVCSAALAVVNYKTQPIIRENAEIKRMMTVLNVFGVTYDIMDPRSIRKTYLNRIDEIEENGLKLFREKESGSSALYLSGNGFQGPISLVVALKDDSISGFKIISQTETPGLGSRIMEEGFQKQFIGKKVSKGITLIKNGNAGPSEFDAVTGATESSKALSRILNNGFTTYYHIKTGAAVPKNLDSRLMASVLDVMGISCAGKDSMTIKNTFASRVTESEENGQEVFRDKTSGITALFMSGNGFQSTLTFLVALNGDTINGFRIISGNDSPGLGGRMKEESFQRQFIGKKVSHGIALVKNGKAGPSEFAAISKATVSSQSIARILNASLAEYYHIAKSEAAASEIQSPDRISATEDSVEQPNTYKRYADATSDHGATGYVLDSAVHRKTDAVPASASFKSDPVPPPVKERGDTVLYLSGVGFQDSIIVMVALHNDTIRKFKILKQNETPGMGSRITEDDFQHQFIGKKVSHEITLVQSGKAGPSEFDAITGATETSKALSRILNTGFKAYIHTLQ